MKTLITGHRKHKLLQYDIPWIKEAIDDALDGTFITNTTWGLSGVAGGVDLWFCETLLARQIGYTVYPPFEGQELTMDEEDRALRTLIMNEAGSTMRLRNSSMVEAADAALVVFDGNKGGTANVFQQLIEKNKPFVWINPVAKKIWECR